MARAWGDSRFLSFAFMLGRIALFLKGNGLSSERGRHAGQLVGAWSMVGEGCPCPSLKKTPIFG